MTQTSVVTPFSLTENLPLSRLLAQPQIVQLDADTLDAWLKQTNPALLFFTGAGNNRTETQDVAVVLLELIKLFGQASAIAVIAQKSEASLRDRFSARVLPALIFLKDGIVMQVIYGIGSWAAYHQAFATHFGRS